jgi:3-phenylpropionate/trans-cinnamate dioxygenase ferredoxin subunit
VGVRLMAEIDVCPVDELPPGSMKLVTAGHVTLGVYNLDGRLCAIEDRCSHDDGPLVEGDWEPDEGVVICPRHGSRFDICTGQPLTLPAYEPVPVFPVRVEDGIIKVEVES